MYPSLAIDCSDQVCSIAISDGNKVSQVEEEGTRRQARKILSLLENCLFAAGLKKEQLRSICWAAGPGSFTGLRIATAVAQGLAYSLKLPLTPISSLEAMANAAMASSKSQAGKILAISDARMGEYYWALFEINQGIATRQSEDTLSSIEQIELPNDLSIVVGSGAGAIEVNKATIQINQCPARARDLFALAEIQIAEGKQVSAMEAEPIYLRSKSAWKTLEQQ